MAAPHPPQPAVKFILVSVALAVVGGGIIIPVLPGLVRQFEGGDYGAASHSYGWIILAFAVMQFVGSPVLGVLSDQFGRRRVILIAIAGSAVDYVIMALAPNLAWLVVGRAISGLTAGIIGTANAYLVDVTPPEKRAQYFGLLGAAFGLGFVIGPVLGGLLGGISLRLPFWAAAGFATLNLIYGWFVLPESLPASRRRKFSWRRANPIGSLLALRTNPVVAGLAGSHLLFWIAQTMLHATWVLYTGYRHGWGPTEVGLSLGLVGVSSAIVQAGLVKHVLAAIGETRGVIAGFSITLFVFIGYGVATEGWMLYALIVLGSIGSISGPALQSYLSRRVAPDEQGSVQGALTALTSAAAIIGQPVAAWSFGWAVAPGNPVHLPGIPFFEAAAITGLSILLVHRAFRRAALEPATEPAPATGGG